MPVSEVSDSPGGRRGRRLSARCLHRGQQHRRWRVIGRRTFVVLREHVQVAQPPERCATLLFDYPYATMREFFLWLFFRSQGGFVWR